MGNPVRASSGRPRGAPDKFQGGRSVCVCSGGHGLLGRERIGGHKTGGGRTRWSGPSEAEGCVRAIIVEVERRGRTDGQ